jgi:hypothetical protein
MELLGIVGNLTSIAGLLVSLYVLVTVRKIRKAYTASATLPSMERRLSKLARELAELLNDYEANTQSVETTIARCNGLTHGLGAKLSGEVKGSLRDLRRTIRAFRQSPVEHRQREARRVYNEAQSLVAALKTHIEDLKWER